jgi:hypothetical protein
MGKASARFACNITYVLKQGRAIHVIRLAAQQTRVYVGGRAAREKDLFLKQLLMFPRKSLEPAIHLFQARLNFILVGLFGHYGSHRVLGSSHPDPFLKVYSVHLFTEEGEHLLGVCIIQSAWARFMIVGILVQTKEFMA